MNDKPVILQVLPTLDIGGAEQGAVDMAGAVVLGGGRALVASGPGRLLSRLRYVGGEHITLPLPKSFSPLAFRRKVSALCGLIRREGVSLVHARSRYPALVAAAACEREGIPLVTTWHGVHHARIWVKRRYNSALLKGERVITVSQYMGGRLQKEYGLGPDRLRIVPRGCDPANFDPDHIPGRRVQALLDQWDIPEGSRVVLVPGRLTPWKGQNVAVAALERVVQHCPGPWVCVLAGPETNPAYAHSLYQKARAFGVTERLRFVGACLDMPAAYQLAHVVVVPSVKPEPFGRVAVEAQMMGRPVIGSALGGLAETIIHDETGLLVPPNDPVALAIAIINILGLEDDAWLELGARARMHALTYYAVEQMQMATLGIYDELLGTTLREHFLSAYHEQQRDYRNRRGYGDMRRYAS